MSRDKNDDDSSATDVTTSGPSHLVLHSKVFTLAHVYDIADLRKWSIDKFQLVARLQWKSECLLDAAREAYTATPPAVFDMREATVKTFSASLCRVSRGTDVSTAPPVCGAQAIPVSPAVTELSRHRPP
uniref:Uncharacterized protein n=1 Tax=Bionectria ochroleuca TaxID=29856 RepID=A0A8H7K6Q2_BIOOC